MYKVLRTEGNAKRAVMETVHGTIQTPVFMNVGIAISVALRMASFSAFILALTSTIIASSFSHIGFVWQQVERAHADGPWLVQETAFSEPSVSFRILPTVYSDGLRFKR